MPAPLYTSETQFAEYLTLAIGPAVINDLAIDTVWLEVVVQDVMLDLGVTDIAAATDLRKLRAWGKLRVWEWITNQYVPDYRYTTDGESKDRHQRWEHAKTMLALSRTEVEQIKALEIIDEETATGGFDWAEEVVSPFNARERLLGEYRRGSF